MQLHLLAFSPIAQQCMPLPWMPRKEVRQRTNMTCSLCKEPCYNQHCTSCQLPLCQQCLSRPHQCASRRARNSAAPCDHHLREVDSAAGEKGQQVQGPPNGDAPLEERREISKSSMNSEAEARDISSSSMNSTDSAASRRPWHMSDSSQGLFSQYFQMRQQHQQDECVSQ